MDIFAKRINNMGQLIPAYDSDLENICRKTKIGDIVKLKLTTPRNLGHHRKFFAFLNCLLHHMPEDIKKRYRNTDDIRYDLCLLIGHTYRRELVTGETREIPKTINFADMDQEEFDIFYKKAVNAALDYMLPGVDEDTFGRIVIDFL